MSSTIDEYKELRSEIRNYAELGQKNRHFALIVFVGTLAVQRDNPNSLLCFASALVIFFLWVTQMGFTQATFRVATYIEKFIEPKVEGLKWETLGSMHPIQTNYIYRIIANATYPILLCTLVMDGILKAEANFYVKIILFIIFLIIPVSFAVKGSYQLSLSGRTNELIKWDKLEKDYAEMSKEN